MKVKLPFSENKAPLKASLFAQGLPCRCTRVDSRDFPKPHQGKAYFTACYQKSLHYRSRSVSTRLDSAKRFSNRFAEHFDDVDQVFRPSERSRLVYEILLRCPYRSADPILTGKKVGFRSSRLRNRNDDGRR